MYTGVCSIDRVGKEMIGYLCCGGYYPMRVLSYRNISRGVYEKGEQEHPKNNGADI